MPVLLKLRFAPSPTGFLHVGGARTAIFNLLYARRFGGSLLLRIEDTDVERSRQHHAEQIINSLEWLGVEWDEGPVYQSDRLPRYRQRAEELVTRGLAYRCYCSAEELEIERAAAEKTGKHYRYSGRCRRAAEAGRIQEGDHVIRFKVHDRPIDVHDLVRGDVHFEGHLIDDFVLLRSDGHPTYHLSVVVDDIDMQITLVARGDDHLSNTPKHILLFDAFGAAVPRFAHLPLILGTDKKRLSKRSGATSVEEYRELGILPDALFNFLTLLGWSPGNDLEIFSRSEAARLFDFASVNKAPAVFDQEKLNWMNSQYLMSMKAEEIVSHLGPFLPEDVAQAPNLLQLIALYQPRARTLKELAEAIRPYFVDPRQLPYEQEAVNKHLKGAEIAPRIQKLRAGFSGIEAFSLESTEAVLRKVAEEEGVGAGKLIHPLRLAVTGKGSSPPIFDVLVALGKDRSLARIDRFLEELPSLAGSRD